MADLTTFKDELTLLVNNLAKAVVTEADKVCLNKQNPESEEKFSSLVDSLCLEAVDKILKMVELAVVKQEESSVDLSDPPGDQSDPPGGLDDPPGGLDDPPGGLDDPPGGLDDPPGGLDDPPGGLDDPPESAATTEGVSGGGEAPPTAKTYVLVFRGAAANNKGLLVSLQSIANANANGENKTVSTDATGETTTLHSERSTSSPPPDITDHEYAQPTPPLSGSASPVKSRVSAARKRYQRRRKKEPKTSQRKTRENYRKCSKCGRLFPNTERLSEHERKFHPECSVCGLVCNGHKRMHEHVMKEHGLLPYACDHCPKRFNHKAHRNLHMKVRHTGEKTSCCDICGKGYSSISLMKTHRRIHFERTFICDVCGKSFYQAGHLTRHKVVHMEVRPFQCSTCGKRFNQAPNLRTHQEIHNTERQLCFICGKTFRFLRKHVITKHSQRLHTDELSAKDSVVTCRVCGKMFPHPSQLKIHQMSHTGEKPFHCDICGKGYLMKKQMMEHRYTHTGEKPYRCTLCPKAFHMATSLKRHLSIHTGETPHSCLDCGKHFRLLTFLKAHQQTKSHLLQMQRRQSATSDL